MKERCAAFVLILLCAASLARAQAYRWPLDSERKLSSCFGEYRDGHYHAGIDLRTFGRIGLPCLAVGGCEAARIRVSPKGYGKALYLRLRDGRMAVYAHLNGFSRALDSLAYHWRLERGRSTCDIDVEPGAFAFEAGETVAYSGATGSPHPHLHFEMRGIDGKPFNPLESLFDVPDACVPIISGIEVVPLSWGSLVNGSPIPFTSHFRLTKGGGYALEDTLRLDGVFGFGVSAYDKQLRGSYRMGPYSVELSIDGKSAYRVWNSRFDYSQINDIALEYDERNGKAPGRYLVLFNKPANGMSDREGSGIVSSLIPREGALVLASGIHRGEIAVRDVKGNEARGTFCFVLHGNPELAISRSGADAARIRIDSYDPDGGVVSTALSASVDGGKTWNAVALERSGDGFEGNAHPDQSALYRCIARDDERAEIVRYFAYPAGRQERDSVFCDVRPELRAEGLYLRIKADRALASIPSIRRAGEPYQDSLRAFAMNARESVAFVPVDRLASGVNLFSIRGRDARGFPLDLVRAFQLFTFETGTRVSFNASDSFEVQLRAPSVRGRGAVLLRDASVPGGSRPGLEAVTPAFSIEFAPESFSRPLLCGFDEGVDAGLFRWNGRREGWRCVGVPGREGGQVEIRRPGVYAVLKDTKAPLLRRLASMRRSPGSGFFKRRLYYIPVHEGGSGIDSESGVAIINGVRVVCEWDEYRGRLEIPIPRSHASGPAKLRVELADRAGNRSTAEFNFVID